MQALPLLHVMHDCSHTAFGPTPTWHSTAGRFFMDFYAGANLTSWHHQVRSRGGWAPVRSRVLVYLFLSDVFSLWGYLRPFLWWEVSDTNVGLFVIVCVCVVRLLGKIPETFCEVGRRIIVSLAFVVL